MHSKCSHKTVFYEFRNKLQWLILLLSIWHGIKEMVLSATEWINHRRRAKVNIPYERWTWDFGLQCFSLSIHWLLQCIGHSQLTIGQIRPLHHFSWCWKILLKPPHVWLMWDGKRITHWKPEFLLELEFSRDCWHWWNHLANPGVSITPLLCTFTNSLVTKMRNSSR